MDKWISRFREAKTVDGQPKMIIPGDPERESEVTRMKDGIPLNSKVVEDLQVLAKKLGVEFPD
jgi:LDH2 family malate/lactate/ureidoglycolate dehydrogenase